MPVYCSNSEVLWLRRTSLHPSPASFHSSLVLLQSFRGFAASASTLFGKAPCALHLLSIIENASSARSSMKASQQVTSKTIALLLRTATLCLLPRPFPDTLVWIWSRRLTSSRFFQRFRCGYVYDRLPIWSLSGQCPFSCYRCWYRWANHTTCSYTESSSATGKALRRFATWLPRYA